MKSLQYWCTRDLKNGAINYVYVHMSGCTIISKVKINVFGKNFFTPLLSFKKILILAFVASQNCTFFRIFNPLCTVRCAQRPLSVLEPRGLRYRFSSSSVLRQPQDGSDRFNFLLLTRRLSWSRSSLSM